MNFLAPVSTALVMHVVLVPQLETPVSIPTVPVLMTLPDFALLSVKLEYPLIPELEYDDAIVDCKELKSELPDVA